MRDQTGEGGTQQIDAGGDEVAEHWFFVDPLEGAVVAIANNAEWDVGVVTNDRDRAVVTVTVVEIAHRREVDLGHDVAVDHQHIGPRRGRKAAKGAGCAERAVFMEGGDPRLVVARREKLLDLLGEIMH